MPFNALLLPLLGGFIFVNHWNPTRFDTRRYSGERLLLHSAIAGVVVLFIAFLATRGVMIASPALHAWWRSIVPFEYTGTSLLAFGLGALGWVPMNRFWDRETEARKAVEQWGDFLEVLLDRSVGETRQVSLSLAAAKSTSGS
jgi:protein-S-isoprenylcysteine O-methyltransferase Ste14